jgi:hypothetical protein
MGVSVNEEIKEAFYHIFKELEILNILDSLKTCDLEEIRNAHNSIHEFLLLAPLSIPSTGKVTWQQKSAFLTYQWEAFHSAHRALIEALAGFYNSGYTLLRNTLELLVRGAFWECLAHKNFRAHTGALDEDRQRYGRGRKSIRDWIEDLIKRKPSIKESLENISGGIFDKTATILEDKEFQREFIRIPPFSVIVKQLIEWKVIDIQNAYQIVYNDLYDKLSKDVHVIPDRTDIGRRLLQEKNLFRIGVNSYELNGFIKNMHKVIDVGIVIELNILSDWINKDGGVQARLKGRLEGLKELGLEFGFNKLSSLISL